ncbi:hypothetical protein C8Q75DRAFT_365072 [Abortiporus biennis]|nr:hypothetical protein C8Q75DRAFT_365072 [Abortiporus biennis]
MLRESIENIRSRSPPSLPSIYANSSGGLVYLLPDTKDTHPLSYPSFLFQEEATHIVIRMSKGLQEQDITNDEDRSLWEAITGSRYEPPSPREPRTNPGVLMLTACRCYHLWFHTGLTPKSSVPYTIRRSDIKSVSVLFGKVQVQLWDSFIVDPLPACWNESRTVVSDLRHSREVKGPNLPYARHSQSLIRQIQTLTMKRSSCDV